MNKPGIGIDNGNSSGKVVFNSNNDNLNSKAIANKDYRFKFVNCDFYMALYKFTCRLQFYIPVIIVDIDFKHHLIKIRPALPSYRYIGMFFCFF